MPANQPPYGSNENYLPMLKKNLGIDDKSTATPNIYVQAPIDRPTLGGANQSAYGITNGTTPATAVGVPTANTYRVVYMVTAVNTTGGVVDIKFQVDIAGTKRVVAQTLAVAAGGEFLRNWQGGLVLLPGQSLEVLLGDVGVIPWSAHWADPIG